MSTPTTSRELARWNSALATGNPNQIATTARELAEASSQIDTSFRFTLCDKLWRPQGDITGWLMEGSGTDPRNNTPTGKLAFKSNCPFVETFESCRDTMVGIIVETAGLRLPFYVKKHNEHYENGAWTHNLEIKGIWDILNYLVIWPSWFLPIQAQPFSHAVFIWALCTVLENMVAECALRIQSGLWEFVNNALSLNPDIRAWFGTLLLGFQNSGGSEGSLLNMLKTPIYVKRTNPFLDTSPLVARTVRMETCAAVITDITRAYGVDTRMDLWLPAGLNGTNVDDPQPDPWANLTQPTYVFSATDRSQIEGPTKTVLDSVLRTIVDLGGAFFGNLGPIIQQVDGQTGVFESPLLGVEHVPPWAIVVAPDSGEDSAVISCDIDHHTQEGWQHIIGGRSPKWLNDLINVTTAFIIDAIMIVVGFTGIPSDLLAGFLNNSFLAFQLIQHYERRSAAGPYHPAIERFHATASAPYNIETVFAFINALFDSRGYSSAVVKLNVFGPKAQYTLGRDIFKGGLMSVVFRNRRKMITDYIENVMWRITPTERELIVQLGDGKRDEAPLAKHQRFLTAVFESINTLTLAPQSG